MTDKPTQAEIVAAMERYATEKQVCERCKRLFTCTCEPEAPKATPRTVYYVAYVPDLDSVDGGGFWLEVEDFHPCAFKDEGVVVDLEEEDRQMRAATRDCGTEGTHKLPWDYAVLLPVPASNPPGFTYAELRKASIAYRAEHGLGCYVNTDPKIPGHPLCSAPVAEDGRCEAHRARRSRG